MSSYWVNRHRNLAGQLRSVANIGLSEEANRQDYTRKREEVKAFLLRNMGSLSGLSVWDAGAGLGHFSKLLQECGAGVCVSDISPEAIAFVKNDLQLDHAAAQVSNLSATDWGETQFGLVMCLDVLYHVLEDGEWERTLEKFASYATQGILIQEHLEAEASNPNTHIRWRTHQMYDDKLSALGWGRKDQKSYQLPRSGSRLDLILFVPKEEE